MRRTLPERLGQPPTLEPSLFPLSTQAEWFGHSQKVCAAHETRSPCKFAVQCRPAWRRRQSRCLIGVSRCTPPVPAHVCMPCWHTPFLSQVLHMSVQQAAIQPGRAQACTQRATPLARRPLAKSSDHQLEGHGHHLLDCIQHSRLRDDFAAAGGGRGGRACRVWLPEPGSQACNHACAHAPVGPHLINSLLLNCCASFWASAGEGSQ